ncbi:MAG TPA: efflux RND transporter periplasmic adaptor subunit, partial [Bryobacteraceae bacterium]|nr:efflux RND transporter periplasmic adaptor subunit [Bryobacteraceae bacterium]
WVRFKVTESQYLSFKKNPTLLNSALALIPADGAEFPEKGRIANTLNQVDPKTGTLELQASFPNPQHTLLPGQFGKVRVETELRRNAILVPQRAIQQLQSETTVLTVGPGNIVELHAIKTAERVGENWIVQQGLKPGDRVIVEGQLKVRPGARVSPTPYHSAAGEGR